MVFAAALLLNGAVAEAAGVCKPGPTENVPLPLPADLVPRARQVFQLAMPDDLIRKTTVYRCMNGRTLLCTTGANLSCGKANLSRDLPGAVSWCREHTESDSVPMFATGHDTIYRWRCSNGTPVIAATVEPVDAEGFLSRNWKAAED